MKSKSELNENVLTQQTKGSKVAVHRKVVPNHTVLCDITSKLHPNRNYANNKIRTTKYTLISFIPKNLFEQFHRFANLYFLGIQLLNWVPGVTAFAKEVQIMPLVFVLGVTAVKDIFEDRRRYRSDKRVNNSSCRVYNRTESRFIKINWKDVKVGDIVHLSVNESVPADILILRTSDEQGLCYVETSNLDGESNLKQRQVVRGFAAKQQNFQPFHFTSTIECDAPNNQIYRFNGFIVEKSGERIAITKDNLLLRDCILKNTDFVDGIVVYAGHETKAMLNNGGPRYKRSKLERNMNRDVIWCVVILLLLCTMGSIGYGLWLASFNNVVTVPYLQHITEMSPSYDGFKVFWTFIILYQVMIPLSLYVAIEMIKLGQIYHIHEDNDLYDQKNNKRVVCRALNITEDLGQIEYIFSDKTGTLTENKMVFRRCSIGGIDYNHKRHKSDENQSSPEDNHMTNDFVLNPYLKNELSLMGEKLPEEIVDSNTKVSYQLSSQSQRILDFFILLAVCNSAVASRHPHKDQMSGSGQYLNEIIDSPKTSPLQNSIPKASPALNQTTNTTTPAKRPFYLSVIPIRFSPSQRTPSPSHSPSPSPLELKPIYESESPDEVALVTAAFRYNCRLLKRNSEMVKLSLPSEGIIEFQVLNILPFDSTRKKMSIILRHPITDEIILYCKGSDSAIFSSLAKTKDKEMQQIIEITQKQLNSYSRKGLRTLCMSKRILTQQQYNQWNKLHKKAEQSIDNNEQLIMESSDRIEQNLILIGATGIEDSLQERVPEVIASLRTAGIIVWVLTGDKQETAVNIAYSCRLFTNDMEIIYLNVRSRETAKEVLKFHLKELKEKLKELEKQKSNKSSKSFFVNLLQILVSIYLMFSRNARKRPKINSEDRSKRGLVVDGKTLSFVLEKESINSFIELSEHCNSVLCCRATPLQKASVVKCVKEKLNVMTLAIGDGANDVSMIQTADVGIGISGQEGTQAVMASDFALSRFHFLERLLLVHGNWCYDRLSRVVLYFFYKNSSSIFVIFWFQIYCGFSGSIMIDQLYLMIVNVMFTAFPPMILGIYDRDCPAAVLLKKPYLYSRGRKSKVYTEYSFWVNMLDAAYQSVVIFFIPVFIYYDSTLGIYEFGTIIITCCVSTQLVHISIETKSWTLLHAFSLFLSIIMFFTFAFLYNALTLGSSLFSSDSYMVIQQTSTDYKYWWTLLVVTVMAPMPRCLIRILQTTLTPSQIVKAVKDDKTDLKTIEIDEHLNNVPKQKRTFSAVWTRKSSSAIMLKKDPIIKKNVDNKAIQN